MQIRLFVFLLLAALPFLPLYGAAKSYNRHTTSVHCASELQNSLQAIKKIKEGNALINNILKQGNLSLSTSRVNAADTFGACWDPGRRIIYISLAAHMSQDELIGSIIFELFNALQTSKFNQLYDQAAKGKINREEYIQKIEHIEYQNSIDAAKLINIGIENKTFGKNIRLNVYKTFDEYFYYQKMYGHSAFHGANYDDIVRNKWL